jgi:serine phosphatase RsbU (regulator of sigma subunit)
MADTTIDYSTVFAFLPAPCMLLDTDLVIRDVNEAYTQMFSRSRENLLGQRLFDVFSDSSAALTSGDSRSLAASLKRVLSTRTSDALVLHKHDVQYPGDSETVDERRWSAVNTPVLDVMGEVRLIVHQVADVTAYTEDHLATQSSEQPTPSVQAVGAGLFSRTQELQRLYEELRQAHAEEREVALALQTTMLYAPAVERHKELSVRYLPAVSELNVCGDWFDVADVSEEHMGAAVGDVVGHGLEAAMVMGMLRSALSGAIRASEGPARALEALGMYAESVEGALGTTAVKVLINKRARLITYSSAGHPPPVLRHADGTCELLDKATDPPLGVWSGGIPRSQASLPFSSGDWLVLYTDGLIEKRGEDIDVGIARLTDALSRCVERGADRIADTILEEVGVTGGAPDDIALLVICL